MPVEFRKRGDPQLTPDNIRGRTSGPVSQEKELPSSSPENFARYIEFPRGLPRMTVGIGVARGGTTAMGQVLGCSPSFTAYGEDALRNAIAYPQGQGREPDTIQMPGEGDHVFLKETYGPATESMVAHYPIDAWRLAARRAGISDEEFNAKTSVLGITRDPLAIYNGWLKYWALTKDLPSIDEAYEQFGDLSLTNLAAAYDCFTDTVLKSRSEGLNTKVVVAKMFENPAEGVEGVFQKISDELGIEFTPGMVMFRDPNKAQKRDIYPVTVDAKYRGLHEDIDDRGFRYLPPKYKYSGEVLPSLRDAGLIEAYKSVNSMAKATFGHIDLPSYMKQTGTIYPTD